MSAMSDYLENEILDHILGTGSFTSPTPYLALFTAVTGLESNSPTSEVSGGSYARQTVAFSAASGGATNNSADVEFPEATASWGTVSHFAIMDAVSSGNVLLWGELTSSKAIASGDTAVFRSGEIDVTAA